MTETTDAAIENRELPPDVAEAFRIALDADEPPDTIGDWLDDASRHLEDAGADPSFGDEELCLADSTRHEARIGEAVEHFQCVLDPLLLPFVLEDATDIEVRSESPVSDAVVTIDVTRDDLSVDPGDAVVSFGVAADVDPPGDDQDALAYGYAAFCPYINAFADREEYEEWADETPAAATMALSVADAHALAGRLGRRLTA